MIGEPIIKPIPRPYNAIDHSMRLGGCAIANCFLYVDSEIKEGGTAEMRHKVGDILLSVKN